MATESPRARSRTALRPPVRTAVAALFAAVCFAAPVANAVTRAQVETGKAISGFCTGCHGDTGEPTNAAYPRLAGQNYKYLVHALKAFQSGQWNSPLMHSIVVGMSPAQMEALAAYYSSLNANSCSTDSGHSAQ